MPSQLAVVPIRPGPPGLDDLRPALIRALEGTGPAVAPIPFPRSAATKHGQSLRVAVRPEDPVSEGVAAVLATSGSTGPPAAVELRTDALLAAADGLASWLGQRPGRSEDQGHDLGHIWVAALPLYGAGGFMTVVRALRGGAPNIGTPWLGGAARFDMESFVEVTACAREASQDFGRPLAISLVPTMLAILASAGDRAWDSLRAYDVVLLGGAATPEPLLALASTESVRVVTSYGMTETCGGAVFNSEPMPGVSVTSRDGVLSICGPNVARGYRDGRDPDRWIRHTDGLTTFRTSDLGEVSTTGIVTVGGRADDVVQVGGRNVNLAAVRAALAGVVGVGQAEVVAIADSNWGARIVAFVVPVETLNPPDASHLMRSVADLLGQAAAPREIRFASTLPSLPGGKVDSRALQRMATWKDTMAQ